MEDHLSLNKNVVCERPEMSYANLHQEIAEKGKNIPPEHIKNHQNQHGKAVKGDELVKYMSKLPTYLERGENHKEKFLNVGVLDWGRLEKWQHQYRQIPERMSRHSVSSSNPFSSFSTDASPACSSSGQSCSLPRQRMGRPSLKDHLMSSPAESYPPMVKSSEEIIYKSTDVKNVRIDSANEQGKFKKTVKPFSENHLEMKIDQRERHFDPKICSKSLSLGNGTDDKALKQKKVKVKTKARDCQLPSEMDNPVRRKADVAYQDVCRKSKLNAHVMPRDLPQTNRSGVPHLDNPPKVSYQVAVEVGRTSFAEMPKETGFAGMSYDVPHSCPLPRELDRSLEINKQPIDSGCCSILPDSSQSVPHPVKKVVAPFRSRITELKRPIVESINTSNDSSAGPDQNLSKAAVEKGRSTSPFRRLSIGMAKISKSFSSKEVSSAPQSNSTHSSGKSGSVNAMAPLCQDNSSGDTWNATSRARSPLRRLLDPLLKPKELHCQNPGVQLNRSSKVIDTACKSSISRSDLSAETADSGKDKLDMNCCRVNNIDASQDIKQESSTFQALLQVAVKNGQPFFTFAVDNESDILAATMKKLDTSREDDYSCIYTFFAIQEVKKKNGRWINQGNKGKCHDYVPNVVAQLKVYGSQFSNLSRKNFIEHSFAREYVLLAVDLQQLEQQPLEFRPNNELAAIVVKIPKVICRTTFGDDFWMDKCKNQETRFSHTYEEDVICSQSLINATVILPSGTHSLPSKGGPSSLIQRWRSGGSCDCGGWDVGCKLRILVNQNKLDKKTSPSKALHKFEFIAQGGEEERQSVFSLSPFKDGIYSVEFNSSLSMLQAFSLCIAVLDSIKLCESSYSNLLEEKTSLEEIMLAQNIGAPNGGAEGDFPARYVSYPPLSPVGRV